MVVAEPGSGGLQGLREPVEGVQAGLRAALDAGVGGRPYTRALRELTLLRAKLFPLPTHSLPNGLLRGCEGHVIKVPLTGSTGSRTSLALDA